MTTNEKIEKKCKELWSVYFEGSGWKSIDYPSNSGQKIAMERLARHVLASELEAEKHALEVYAEYTDFVKENIMKINNELLEIRS